MSKVFYDKQQKRYTYRETVTYKGEKKRICGTSVNGKTAAKLAFSKKVNEWKAKIDAQDLIMKGDKSLSEALNEWYDLYKRPLGLAPTTIRSDMDTMKQISNSNIGEKIVSKITSVDIQKNLNALAEIRSNSIIKKRYLMLKMYFEIYATINHAFNPMSIVVLPKSKKQQTITSPDNPTGEKLAYSDEQIKVLCNYLKIPFDKAQTGKPGCGTIYGRFLMCILFLCARYGEMAELRVRDISFSDNIVRISRQWCSRSKTVRLPKYNSIRSVPIAKEIRSILLEACVGKRPDDLVFRSGELNKDRTYLPSAEDGHIRESVALQTLHRAEDYVFGAENIVIPHHSIHDLRHDGISMYVRRGISPQEISRMAGHKNVSFTMDRYFRQTKNIDPVTMEKITGEQYATVIPIGKEKIG